jgi:hypothetical protein
VVGRHPRQPRTGSSQNSDSPAANGYTPFYRGGALERKGFYGVYRCDLQAPPLQAQGDPTGRNVISQATYDKIKDLIIAKQ